jgi:hypothetical protein
MEQAKRVFSDAWVRMPADQQLLWAGAALLALGFALLFWTPLGNRPVARYCFGMAVLCHLLLWGVAKHLGWDGGRTSAAVVKRVIDIDLDPTDGSASPAQRSDSANDLLKTAVLDPRDRSTPIEAPRIPIRNKEDSPLATEPKETETPKAPALPKSEAENVAATPPPLARPSETKEEFTPARAVDLPPTERKKEAKEPTTATPRLRDDRLAVAPDDPYAEIRIPNLPTQKTDPLDFSRRPVELATGTKAKEEIEFSPAPAPVDRPEQQADRGKKEGDSKIASDIERMSRTIRRDTPLATDTSRQIASALPIPKTTRPTTSQPEVGSSLKLQTSGGSSTLDPDLAGSFAPAAAPVETAATTESATKPSPTMPRKLGPGGDLSGRRSDDHRGELLRRFGGNTETEQAVALALVWLAAHQDPSGKWDCDGFMKQCPDDDQCEGKAIEKDSDVGVTGIALLAFLGAGHTHRGDTRYRETVRKGLNWLLLEQGEDGHLMGKDKLGRVYSHAIATLALSEAYQMTADERLRPYCQKAIDWLVAAQSPELGGWRYSPRIDSDTSVFGWAVMALASGRQAGFRVPEACWSKAQSWLPKVSSGSVGELACYQPGRQPTPAMTAEALVCRQLFGLSRESDVTAEAAIYLLGRMPNASEPNIYYWYYGTVSMFQVGGPRWERWNDALQQAILRGQRRSGHQKGSFDPGHPWGVDGGRVFSTATSALCLEVYYRHLPIYKDTSDPR